MSLGPLFNVSVDTMWENAADIEKRSISFCLIEKSVKLLNYWPSSDEYIHPGISLKILFIKTKSVFMNTPSCLFLEMT